MNPAAEPFDASPLDRPCACRTGCLRRCSDLGQFWGWIKHEKAHYHERRDFIWAGFRPLIEYL